MAGESYDEFGTRIKLEKPLTSEEQQTKEIAEKKSISVVKAWIETGQILYEKHTGIEEKDKKLAAISLNNPLWFMVTSPDLPKTTPKNNSIDTPIWAPTQKIETSPLASTEKINTNDSAGVALTGSTEIRQETKVAQDAIKSGNPDVIQKVKDIFNSFPDGFKKFFGPLLAMFEKLSSNNWTDTSNEQIKEKTSEVKELLAKLEGSEINLWWNKAKLDTSKITLEKTPGSNNFTLKSTQTWFQFIDGPLEVNSDGKIQTPNNTITLKWVPWYAPWIKDGKYSLSQVGKSIDIKPITTSEWIKA